jgi:hypothetical protein
MDESELCRRRQPVVDELAGSRRKAASGSESATPPVTTIELRGEMAEEPGFTRPLPNSVVAGESK